MLPTAILVFREVLEASLIIGIVCAATRGIAARSRWIGSGIVAGTAGALLVALFADAIGSAINGVGHEIFNAAVLLTAVAMIAWHAIWMARHGRELAQRTRRLGSAISAGEQPMIALLAIVAIAVLREGAEVVLFILAQGAGGANAGELAIGIALGIVAGAATGAALYAGLLRIPMRHFFSATNWLLLLVAAGMAAQAAHFLVQADILPSLGQLWDSSALISPESLAGRVLHALVGYDAQPAGIQVAFFVITAVAIHLGMRRTSPPRTAASSQPTT
jgi:high-affinity iron transporter